MNDSWIERHLGKLMITLAVVGLAMTVIALFLYGQSFGLSLSDKHSRWAQFGDYVGGVLGSGAALLAFIALLLTLRLQSRELRHSSQELGNSARALADQSASLQLQNFENRLFSMLSLHHQIVTGMDLRKNGNVIASGRDCLKLFYDRLTSKLDAAHRGDHLTYLEGLTACYESFYAGHSHELGHYFRFIYRILKFIDEAEVPNKMDYSGILRAQLSNPELALLFYNGLSSRGAKFKPLAERYALFENLEFSALANQAEDLGFYSPDAFGDQADAVKPLRDKDQGIA